MYGDGPPFDCLEIGGRRVELGPLSADEARSRMGFEEKFTCRYHTNFMLSLHEYAI